MNEKEIESCLGIQKGSEQLISANTNYFGAMKVEKICKIIFHCMSNDDIDTAKSFLQSQFNSLNKGETNENRN